MIIGNGLTLRKQDSKNLLVKTREKEQVLWVFFCIHFLKNQIHLYYNKKYAMFYQAIIWIGTLVLFISFL